MTVTRQRAEQIVTEGCLDDEKWQLAKQWLDATTDTKTEAIQELYDAAKGVQGTGMPIPYAADRVIELIDYLANIKRQRDMQWLDAFVQIDTTIAFVGDPHQYVQAVFEPCLRRAKEEAALNVQLRKEIEKLKAAKPKPKRRS